MPTSRKLQPAAENAKRSLEYLAAAERVLGPDNWPSDTFRSFGEDLPYLASTSTLVGHAVELGLNAYLSAFGASGGLGNHDLLLRLSAAESAGLNIDDDFRKAVIAINGPHMNMQFRYAGKPSIGFVRPRDAIPLVKPTLQGIYKSLAILAYGVDDIPESYLPIQAG